MTQSPQEQIDSLVNKLAATLCRIKKSPKGWLPLIVFVEEQDSNGYLTYHKYMLKKICPDGSCHLHNPDTNKLEHNDYYLTAINTDSLITVWNRYVELSVEQSLWKDQAVKVLMDHTGANKQKAIRFVDTQWQTQLLDQNNIAVFRGLKAPKRNPLEYPLRQLLDIARMKVSDDELSLIDDVCESALRSHSRLPDRTLFAFVWPYALMPCYATEKEILAAYKKGRSRSTRNESDENLYEVRKLTLKEFEDEINSGNCAFGQCYVRFIEI
jgi:hypothetical protein